MFDIPRIFFKSSKSDIVFNLGYVNLFFPKKLTRNAYFRGGKIIDILQTNVQHTQTHTKINILRSTFCMFVSPTS